MENYIKYAKELNKRYDQNDNGATPLHCVLIKKRNRSTCDCYDTECHDCDLCNMCNCDCDIKALIKMGANVNAQDDDGETPLFYSLYYKNGLELLIEAGADVNIKNDDGKTPFQCVLEDRDDASDDYEDDIAVILIKAGADVNFMFDYFGNYVYYTPLHYAIEYNNIKIIKALLEAGADINRKCYVAESDNIEKIEALVKAGVDIGDNGIPPLSYLQFRGFSMSNGYYRPRFLETDRESKICYNKILQVLIDGGVDEIECLTHIKLHALHLTPIPDLKMINTIIYNKKEALLESICKTYISKTAVTKHEIFDDNLLLLIFQFFDGEKIIKKNKKNKNKKRKF
jgi:hypothetical protein